MPNTYFKVYRDGREMQLPLARATVGDIFLFAKPSLGRLKLEGEQGGNYVFFGLSGGFHSRPAHRFHPGNLVPDGAGEVVDTTYTNARRVVPMPKPSKGRTYLGG